MEPTSIASANTPMKTSGLRGSGLKQSAKAPLHGQDRNDNTLRAFFLHSVVFSYPGREKSFLKHSLLSFGCGSRNPVASKCKADSFAISTIA